MARQWRACAPSVAAGCAHCAALTSPPPHPLTPSLPYPCTPSRPHALTPSTPGDERPPSQPSSQPTSQRDAPGAKPAKRGIFGFLSPGRAEPVGGRESKASWADSSTRSDADEAQSPGAGNDSSRKSRSNSFSLRRSKGDGGPPRTRPARAHAHAAPHAAPHATRTCRAHIPRRIQPRHMPRHNVACGPEWSRARRGW